MTHQQAPAQKRNPGPVNSVVRGGAVSSKIDKYEASLHNADQEDGKNDGSGYSNDGYSSSDYEDNDDQRKAAFQRELMKQVHKKPRNINTPSELTVKMQQRRKHIEEDTMRKNGVQNELQNHQVLKSYQQRQKVPESRHGNDIHRKQMEGNVQSKVCEGRSRNRSPKQLYAQQTSQKNKNSRADVSPKSHHRKISQQGKNMVVGVLQGMVPVNASLRHLSTEERRKIAQLCFQATFCMDHKKKQSSVQSSDIGDPDMSGAGKPVCLCLEASAVRLKTSKEEKEQTIVRHELAQLGLFHGFADSRNTLIYAGHSDRAGRVAVLINFSNPDNFTTAMNHLKNSCKRS